MTQRPGAPFQQIKALVRDKVRAGEWGVGEKIPSELELATTFGVARMTVNRALRELTEEGALERVSGVGTFVAQGKPQSNLLMIAHVRDEIRARGHQYACKVISLRRETASAEVAAAFGLPRETMLFHLVCVHLENGNPIQLEDRFVNPAAAPQFFEQDFTVVPPSEYLYKNVSHDGLEIEHIVDASMPTPEQAALLTMRIDQPCLILTRRTWSGGMTVTFAHFLHPANRYRLASRFKPNTLRGQG
ncbi:histidine utilization repressor [Caballeronia sp. J97]|uniref:histidine utilization repressor n=1 Tax=Caballeronia sp. J97 TaxID=2805429 RepID=UPI002AB0375A|nr:histidine utilization repressor [Caballeronia sp. J97]